MKMLSPRALVTITVAAVLAGLVPVFVYWHFFVRPPSVTVAQAQASFAAGQKAPLLVDLRPAANFASNHITGSINLPYSTLKEINQLSELPPDLRDKPLLLVCDTGLSSALAARHLQKLGITDVRNVLGGIAAWQAISLGEVAPLPFHSMSRFEQWLAVIVAFGIKPFYMLLGFIWIVWLWRQPALDLATLRWGLVWFWVGENACSANYLFFDRQSDLWEFFHNYGMAVGFSLMTYALLEGLDARLIKVSPHGDRCAAISLCQSCSKLRPVPCGFQRLFKWTLPAFIIVALLPMTAPFKIIAYQTEILGKPYPYSHPMSCQLFENFYAPLLAVLCFLASWLVLLFKRDHPASPAKVLFAAGVGPLSFGMLRLFLSSTFSQNLLWLDVWEEITELLAMAAIGATLWVFRPILSRRPPRKVEHAERAAA